MLPLGTFSGRVSVVTGGSSGIGEGISQELARLGSTVVLLGRRETALSVAAERIGGATGEKVGWWAVDVRDRSRVEEVVQAVVETYGRIDHLVNSAAGNFQSPPEALSPNAWSAVVRIVLDGTWNCTQVFGRHLIESGSAGSVLSIGTTAAVVGGPSTVHSASAKAGVLAMTKSLAGAWARHGIRLNVLTPGPTLETGAMTHLFSSKDEWEAQMAAIPLGRALSRDEVAHAATYLLSDFAGYITGTNLVMDGGRTLGRGAGTPGG